MLNSINEVEFAASALLETLRSLPLSPELKEIRDYLFPEGMTPVVQLEEDGRKKRSSAAPWNWNPKTGEIRIYLEPSAVSATAEPSTQAEPAVVPVLAAMSPSNPMPLQAAGSAEVEIQPDRVRPDEVIECCQALAAAEKSNRQFIALKWFRDSYLATLDFAWARSPQRRQRVLSEAIEIGRIDAKKIPNPKSDFPTMTITLNRSMPIPGVAPRFAPVVVRGEAVSDTLLRDRGGI